MAETGEIDEQLEINELLERMMDWLAEKTGINEEWLEEAYKDPRYDVRHIPKKGSKNKFRKLEIPREPLKTVQSMLLPLLYRLPVSPVANGSVPGRSVIDNVKPHIGWQSMFKTDFEQAFPRTTRRMVEAELAYLINRKLTRDGVTYLINREKWMLHGEEREALAKLVGGLTTHKGHLPQGAPTSPYLLNLVCYRLDEALIWTATSNNLTYTRYADDLCFSSRSERIPQAAISEIIQIIQTYGFKINRAKTHNHSGNAREIKITGIYLRKGEPVKTVCATGLPKADIDRYRARIHNAVGDSEISESEIFGILSWVTMAYNGQIPSRLRKPLLEFLNGRCPDRKEELMQRYRLNEERRKGAE